MKKVIVTTSWDDGHTCDIQLAALLKKYGIKGTFYISPLDREIDSDKRLKPEQIAALSEDFEIGAHTMTHPRLTKVDEKVAREEMVGSKEYLESVLQKPVTTFCYPGGQYTAAHTQIVQDVGFKFARTVKRFETTIGSDPYAIPTTIHTYRHWLDAFTIIRMVGIRRFFKCYLNWDELAITVFEQTRAAGGVFHLWGHSWEVDKKGDWNRLERVLQHIARYSDVRHFTNSQLELV